MTFFSEHRLLHYVKTDDKTRYSTRIAEQNAAEQARTHQQALSNQQAAEASKQSAMGNDTGAAYYQQQAQTLDARSQPQPLVDENGRATGAGMLNQARTTQNTPNATSYNTQTGQVTDTGFKDVRSGAMGQQGSLGINPRLTDTSKMQAYDGQDLVEFNERKAAIEAQNTEILKQDQIRQETEQAQAANNAASTAAAADSNPSALSQAISSLGPDYAIIAEAQAAHEQAEGAEETAAQSNYASEVAQADKSLGAYGSMLDQMKSDSEKTYQEGKAFAESMQQKREEQLAAQQASTTEQLKWQENKVVRDERRKLNKLVDSLVAAQALGGGADSSNWIGEVAEAEWRGEEAIMDFQKEMGFKRADVDIAFTEQLNGIYEYYGKEKLTALKDHRAEISQINQFRFTATDKTEERKLKAKQDYNNTLAGIAKAEAARIDKATERVLGIQSELRAEKRTEQQQKKTTAYNMFTWAFTNSSDPALRGAAVKMMKDAGYALPENIDLNALTVDDQLALMDHSKQTETSDLYNPGRYTDQDSQMIYTQAMNAVTGLTGVDQKLREGHLNNVARHLDSGDTKAARESVRSIAALKLKGEAPEFSARAAIASESEQLIATLENNPQIRNMYTGKWNDMMKYLAANQNGDYLAITSWLGNLTAETIKERYGSAITDTERTQMERSIPSGKETVQDAITKLKGMIRSNTVKNDAMIDTLMGGTSYSPTSQPQQSYGTDWVLDALGGQGAEGGGSEAPASILMSLGHGLSQDFNTPVTSRSQGGLYDESTVKAWGGKHAGLDIKVPQGTDLPAPTDGTIVSAGYDGGWGGTIVWRDAKGAEHRIAHMSFVPSELKAGTPFRRGQIIGKSGGAEGTKGAGNSTGPHVDYRIKVNGKYIDPLSYS